MKKIIFFFFAEIDNCHLVIWLFPLSGHLYLIGVRRGVTSKNKTCDKHQLNICLKGTKLHSQIL